MYDKSTLIQSLLLGLALAAAMNLLFDLPGDRLDGAIVAMLLGCLVASYLAGLTHGLTAKWKVRQKIDSSVVSQEDIA